jgi:hypothetical protein
VITKRESANNKIPRLSKVTQQLSKPAFSPTADMSDYPSSSRSAASHSSHKPKSSYYGNSKSDHSSMHESTTSSSSRRKNDRHESSRSRMDPPPTLRPAHTSSQRETGRYESLGSTLRLTQDRPSGNDYSFSPAATRHPRESYTQASGQHTGATGSSMLANGQLVKTREVKPDQTSEFPGNSVSKELMRVPGSSRVPSLLEASLWTSRLTLLSSLRRLVAPSSTSFMSSRSRLAACQSTDSVVSKRVAKCRAH